MQQTHALHEEKKEAAGLKTLELGSCRTVLTLNLLAPTTVGARINP